MPSELPNRPRLEQHRKQPNELLAPVQLPVLAGAEVNLCVFVHDGTRAFTAVARDPVRLWDVDSGSCLRTFDASSVHAWAVRAAHDGQSVLVGCRDGDVRLMQVHTGVVSRVLAGHDGMVRCVDVSPDLTRAISGSARRGDAVRLWDVPSERCLQVLEGHRDGVYAVSFDSRQQRALSGSRDATVRAWDLATGRCLGALEGHTYHVHAVAWADDDRRAVSCSRDIRLWDVQTLRCLRVFEGHTDTIRSVTWSSDQRRLLSAAHDRTVRIWDVESGACLQVLAGHSAGAINAVWSDSGREIFSCDWNGEVRRWHDSMG